MLTDSPVARATGPRILFLLGAAVTVAILLWMHSMRLTGGPSGLTTIFFVLFAYQDYGATVCMLLILVAAVFLASRVPARTILRAAGQHPWVVAGITAAVLSVGSLLVYHDHPLSMDEYTAYFQSQVFAAGHLTGQFPLAQKDWLIPLGFQDYFLQISHATGQVASMYWPGHALLLAPFTWASIPWAFNPVVSALTVVVIHRLAMHLFNDVEAAGLAVLLTVASPVIFGNGISYYSMPSHLLANCLYALLLIRPSPARALGAGAIGAFALVLHNPVPHTLFAIPWVVWVATRPRGIRLLGFLCLGYLPLFLAIDSSWFELSRHLRTDGRDLAAAPATTIGRLQAMLALVSAPTSTVYLALAMSAAKVWTWAVPGLVLLAGCGAIRWRQNTICRLFAASALTTLVGYLFFPEDQGHGWGYRYFHSAWMALPLLATAALYRPVNNSETPPEAASRPARTFEDAHTRSYLVACILLTLTVGVGFRAWQMQNFMASDLNQLPHYRGTERRVVIVDYVTSFYGADLVQNDPWLRGSVIRMITHGPADDSKMMAQNYPTLHKVYGDRFGTVWSQAK